MSDAWRLTISEARLRFQFVSELAWTVWRLRDRTVATAARAEYHRQVEARGEARIDRVAHRFHRPGEPRASLLTQYIEDGVMVAELSEELASYEGAPLGESVSETPTKT